MEYVPRATCESDEPNSPSKYFLYHPRVEETFVYPWLLQEKKKKSQTINASEEVRGESMIKSDVFCKSGKKSEFNKRHS